MTAWRSDMENAPRDGHRCLVGGVYEGIGWATIGHWSPRHGKWRDDRCVEIKTPTYWQPLEIPR